MPTLAGSEIKRCAWPNIHDVQVFRGTANRFGHTCHIVGNRQMITVGGIASPNITGTCDWESMGVAILDLTLMRWGSVFDSGAAPYQVNTMISDVVGGGPDGNATKLLPDGGWTSTGLARLFTGSTNQTRPYSPPEDLSNTARSAEIGAIVGGVVGGVAFLALIGVVAWKMKKTRFSPVGSTKEASSPTRVDKIELQSTTTNSRVEAAAVTPVREPSGHGLIPELEGR